MGQSSATFFDELKEWSERKLRLLSNYIDGATRILGTIDHVYYVDGFAGRGTYGRAHENQVPGSPIRAALLARQYKDEGRAYSLSCINVENNRETFDELQSATEPYKDVVKNLFGPFIDNVDAILKIVGDNPVICFLDPFGIDGMDMSGIEKLMRRGGVTDFWIRLEAGEVRRRDGYYSNPEPGADRQFDILRRIYGIYDDNKLHNLLNGFSPQDRKGKAIDLYLKRLSEEFAKTRRRAGFAAAYPINSVEGISKYHLVFSTASKKGLNLASNIVYGIEENYQREVAWYKANRTSQLSLFQLDPSEDEVFDEKVAQIRKQIQATWSGKSVTRQDIHTDLLLNNHWFGSIKGKHLTAALRSLARENQATHMGRISDDNTIFNIV